MHIGPDVVPLDDPGPRYCVVGDPFPVFSAGLVGGFEPDVVFDIEVVPGLDDPGPLAEVKDDPTNAKLCFSIFYWNP